MSETPSSDYTDRTEWNVRDSDGTLILTLGPITGGSEQKLKAAKNLKKPHRVIDLSRSVDPLSVNRWLTSKNILVLNIAGPRESKSPGIYRQAICFLRCCFGSEKRVS